MRPPNASSAAATAVPGPSGVPRSAGMTTGSLARPAAVALELVGRAGDERDPGAGGVEGDGDGRADAATGTGDDRRAPVERAHRRQSRLGDR